MVLREKKIAQLSKIGDLRLSPGGLPNACVLRVYEIPSSTILGIFNIDTQSITSNVAAAVAVGLAVDKCTRRSGETEKKNTRRSRTLSVRVTTLGTSQRAIVSKVRWCFYDVEITSQPIQRYADTVSSQVDSGCLTDVFRYHFGTSLV